jgi:CheY-like chemotaxis protein
MTPTPFSLCARYGVPPSGAGKRSPASHGYSTPSSGAGTESEPTVLIVDDDAQIREALSILLDDEGIRCVTASNGAEAIRLLCENKLRPDMIVLDLMMPIMNGWEFRVAQLANPGIATIPTVILTAATDTSSRAAELGIIQILRKPLDLDQLFQVIENNVPQWQGGN